MKSRVWGWIGVVLSVLLGVCAPAAGQDSPVTVSLKANKSSVAPGDQLVLAIVFDHEESWHIHTNNPVIPKEMGDFPAIPTTITFAPPAGVAVWPVTWPEVHAVRVNFGTPADYGVFSGRAAALIPVQVGDAVKPGETLALKVGVSYQACNESSCLPEVQDELTLNLPVVAPGSASAAGTASDPDFARFDPAVFATPPLSGAITAKPKTIAFNAFGIKFQIDPRGAGLVLLLIVAAFGGFLLNLTPCVLPVVPLKIMGLSAAAGNPARCLMLGTVMSLGVVAFWVAIGAAIAFISGFTAINSLFQTPWFSLGVGAFILLMAVGMLGAYAVRLPQFVYMVNPKHETLTGSFLFGIMTAVLSTPCTAPFMGSAAAWAATQSPFITLLTFGAIGLGMALPYEVLSASPKLVSRIPRTGPASELIKQVMGLLLVAVALFFLGTGIDPLLRLPVDPPMRWHWWIIAGLGVLGMVWLVKRTFEITRKPAARVFWTGFAAVFAAASVFVGVHFTDRGPIPWVGYTPERLAARLNEKKVVVLDFTAEWCINCKAIEAAVLHRPDIVALLKGPDVVPMRVDLTGNNKPGSAKLKELGWVGIPLLAIYGPGASDPIKYDSYTPEMVRDAVAKAAGSTASAQPPAIPRS